MDVTIVVGTYGHRRWIDLAHDRAIPSAVRQDVPVIFRHEDTLADARNAGIRAARTEWVIVLDADDELGEGYVHALSSGTADIRVPALVEVAPDGSQETVPLAGRDIERVNPIPVSAMARREQILAAGGFHPWPAWEDWALWLTMVRRGATYEHIPWAHLLAHVTPGSRNRSVTDPVRLHAQIREASR